MKTLALLALAALLAACAPNRAEQLPSGDYTVRSYGRLFGIEQTKVDNWNVATRNCPKGYILFNERVDRDVDGLYREWEYGCIAE